MGIWVGVDWGCGAHAVCVIDAKGIVLDRFPISISTLPTSVFAIMPATSSCRAKTSASGRS